MTFRDLVSISSGNLMRMKLRTLLTTSGILIAIAAFVSMLSFGAGNQQFVERQFNKLGLFSTLQVYEKTVGHDEGAQNISVLNEAAMKKLSAVPGVNLVYPYDAINIRIKLGDTTLSTRAQALPVSAINTKLFSTFLAGGPFSADSTREAIVSDELLRDAGITEYGPWIGKSIILSIQVSTVDSGLFHILVDKGVSLLDRAKKIKYDSLANSGYRQKVIHTEVNEVLRRFLNGYMNAQQVLRDTLTICGVRESGRMGRLRIEPVLIPVATARRFKAAGFGGSPTEILAAMTSGRFLSVADDAGQQTYSQVTIDFDPSVPYHSIRDSIEAMGFKAFSFAAQFEEIQRAFLYFDLGLGVVGLIALLTASLGIVNTMVMSINERRREIGILKSLGADDSDIRWLFLVESGVIGFLGTVGGIAAGWGISRIVSTIAMAYMRREGVPEMDLFALPFWLITIALVVGVSVSVVAGFFPSRRAARVDPVAALRND